MHSYAKWQVCLSNTPVFSDSQPNMSVISVRKVWPIKDISTFWRFVTGLNTSRSSSNLSFVSLTQPLLKMFITCTIYEQLIEWDVIGDGFRSFWKLNNMVMKLLDMANSMAWSEIISKHNGNTSNMELPKYVSVLRSFSKSFIFD